MQRILILIILLAAGVATADESPTKQASEHFDRGVSLYAEADYRAALVEFRRAYEIAPNAAVLYNLGQTYYQLQNYASALEVFERYIAESGESPSHRAEVDNAIKTLKSRVGKIAITTNLPDSEITVDDEVVGRSPMSAAASVSVGRRKVTALHDGHSPEIRYVDIAAGEVAKLTVDFPPTASSRPNEQPGQPSETPRTNPSKALWITTGVLAAGAITFGILGIAESQSLSDDRNTFPVTQSTLDHKASRVTTYAAIADIAGAAALITGGFALYFTVSRGTGHEVHAGITPGGLKLAGTF